MCHIEDNRLVKRSCYWNNSGKNEKEDHEESGRHSVKDWYPRYICLFSLSQSTEQTYVSRVPICMLHYCK